MKKAKIGIVGLCSPIESGGERHDALMEQARCEISKTGVEVVLANHCVWDAKDALKVCDQFKEADIDAIALIDVTWVMDSLAYIFVKELPVPALLWAVPYPETFSIGCVQDFASVLVTRNIPFEFVYGLAEETAVAEKAAKIAKAGQIIRRLRQMRIALVGPRQTWRVAGPQDMSLEEWEFSEKFGTTLIHIEMEEILDAAEKITDKAARDTLKALASRTGTLKCEESSILWAAKVYEATKALIADYGLDGIAAECYPNYGGQMNQAASWLADEGIVVDTEGDIAHVLIQLVLNMGAEGTPCILGESGSFDDSENCLYVCHEGSSAASVSDSIAKVFVNPADGTSIFIGTPVKAMEHVTFCDLQGSAGNYQLLIGAGSTLPVSHEEWVKAGEKMVMKLRADQTKAGEVIQTMIQNGFHHHLVVKEGDQTELLRLVCRYLGVKAVEV